MNDHIVCFSVLTVTVFTLFCFIFTSVEAIHQSSSEPSLEISPDWTIIRNESRKISKYNICKAHFDAHRDVCNSSTLKDPLIPFSGSVFLQNNCFCDENCYRFDDCCIDKVASNLSSFTVSSLKAKKTPWHCVQVPIHVHGIYAYRECQTAFKSTPIERLCLSEPNSFLQWLPAYSYTSKTLYRNVFCALCNYDHANLHNWNMTVNCDRNTSSMDITPYIRENYFNYQTGLWEFYSNDSSTIIDANQLNVTGDKIRCQASLPELEFHDDRTAFGTRSCLPVISTCATDWVDPSVEEKCYAYTFLIGLPRGNKIYRNPFCALCNHIETSSIRRLQCDLSSFSPDPRSPFVSTYTSLRQMFDIESYSSCSLAHNQVYNPMIDSCLIVQCDTNYTVNPETGRCESLTYDAEGQVTMKSDCLRIFFKHSDYTMLPNQSILLKDRPILLHRSSYQLYSSKNSSGSDRVTGILACLGDFRLNSPLYTGYAQGILSIITSAFSILGLVGYLIVTCFVPKLRNLRARMLMSLSTSLLFANMSLILGFLSRPALSQGGEEFILNTRGSLTCIIAGINLHYWYLSAFAWMNVMAYDALKSFSRTHERLSNSMVHFFRYSVYSWLIPALIVFVAVGFDLSNVSYDYRPMYGHRICWISQRAPLLIFFVAPVMTITTVNGIFFLLTAWYLYRTRKSTRMAVMSKSSQENFQLNYTLYVRLATIMGLTWIFWFFAAFSRLDFLWYIFIILNGLQGVFIFLYFICKHEVYKALNDKLGFLITGHEVSTTFSSIRTTRSASLLPHSSVSLKNSN